MGKQNTSGMWDFESKPALVLSAAAASRKTWNEERGQEPGCEIIDNERIKAMVSSISTTGGGVIAF